MTNSLPSGWNNFELLFQLLFISKKNCILYSKITYFRRQLMANYSAENIKILGDLEHIRLRKGVYIGEAHDPRQLLSEIFDNAIDEVQSGHSAKLQVTVDTKLNKYMVRDWGRGIPHGEKLLIMGKRKRFLRF